MNTSVVQIEWLEIGATFFVDDSRCRAAIVRIINVTI